AGKLHGIDAGGVPPGAFVACAMHGPVMHSAEREREFIACLAAQRACLHVAQLMGIGWLAAAHEAWLLHANPRLVPNSTSLWTSKELWNRLYVMNAQELRRLLAAKGCTFETHKGGSGHVTVRRGDRKSQLPMHGSRKELGKGLINKILKDLGLK